MEAAAIENGEEALVAVLLGIDDVQGAVVWRLGDVPVAEWKQGYASPVAGRMLAALFGGLEKGVEDIGFGHLSQLWWQSDHVQCVGFRAGEWQVLVLADARLDVAGLRTRVAETLAGHWDESESSNEEAAD